MLSDFEDFSDEYYNVRIIPNALIGYIHKYHSRYTERSSIVIYHEPVTQTQMMSRVGPINTSMANPVNDIISYKTVCALISGPYCGCGCIHEDPPLTIAPMTHNNSPHELDFITFTRKKSHDKPIAHIFNIGLALWHLRYTINLQTDDRPAITCFSTILSNGLRERFREMGPPTATIGDSCLDFPYMSIIHAKTFPELFDVRESVFSAAHMNINSVRRCRHIEMTPEIIEFD